MAVTMRNRPLEFSPARQSLGSLPPVSRIDRWILGVVIFLLAYETPAVWFYTGANDTTRVMVTPDRNEVAPVLVAAAAYGFIQLGVRIGPYFNRLRSEPVLTVFLALSVLSLLWSEAPALTLQSSMGICVVAAIGIWAVERFRLAEIITVSAAALSVGTILHFVFIFGSPKHGTSNMGWDGILGSRNTLGRTAILTVAVVYLASRVMRRRRVLCWTFIIANFVLILGSTSKTALVSFGAIGFMAVTAWAFSARNTAHGAVVIGYLIGLGTLIAVGIRNFEQVTGALDRSANLTGRSDIWAAVWPKILERPVQGYGWGAFWNGWGSEARDVWLRLPYGPVINAHNALLDIALGLGLVGAGLTLLLIIRLASRSARLIRHIPGPAARFPLMICVVTVVGGITEAGIFWRDAHTLLLVIAVLIAAEHRGLNTNPKLLRPRAR